MLLRILLIVLIAYIPNSLHFSGDTLAAGLNVTNLLFLLVLGAIPLLAPAHGPRLPGPGILTPALLGMFLVYAVGFLVAQFQSPGDLIADLTTLKTAIFYPLLYFVYRNCRQDLRGTRQLILALLAVTVVAALEAVKQGLEYKSLQNYSPELRSSGPFGPDFLASNLAGYFYAMFLPIFVAAALFLRERRFWRVVAAICSIILAIAIMTTFSRQAYAIALLCLALLALRRSLAIAALIGVLMVAGVGLLPSGVTQRVQETRQTDANGGEELDSSTASRFELWSGAMQMWGDHPQGVGMRRFRTHIGEYTRYSQFDAHNYYVLTLAESGLLGLAAIAWLFWRLWRLSRALLRQAIVLDEEAYALAVGFSLVLVAMALGNMSGSMFQLGAGMSGFWMLCGLLERYGYLRAIASAEEPTGEWASSPPVSASSASAGYPLAARALRPGALESTDGQ